MSPRCPRAGLGLCCDETLSCRGDAFGVAERNFDALEGTRLITNGDYELNNGANHEGHMFSLTYLQPSAEERRTVVRTANAIHREAH